MNKYFAFLRGINVGGHAVVKMTDLRDAFSAAGCSGVKTFIQSGNVIFESPEQDPTVIFGRVLDQLRTLLGSEPGVLFRTMRDLERIVRANPFANFEGETDIGRYVVFLRAKPKAKPKLPLDSMKEALEAIAMKSLEVFIVSRPKPNGSHGFPNNFVEKELGVTATTRNWNTVTKILQFANKGMV